MRLARKSDRSCNLLFVSCSISTDAEKSSIIWFSICWSNLLQETNFVLFMPSQKSLLHNVVLSEQYQISPINMKLQIYFIFRKQNCCQTLWKVNWKFTISKSFIFCSGRECWHMYNKQMNKIYKSMCEPEIYYSKQPICDVSMWYFEVVYFICLCIPRQLWILVDSSICSRWHAMIVHPGNCCIYIKCI